MGQKPRAKPQRLAVKLKQIRLGLGMTLEELAERLEGVPGAPDTGLISRYEQNKREPTLLILLEYARIAGVHLEALVDDDINLPTKFRG